MGMLKDVPVHLEEKIMKPIFFVVEGLPYDVIFGVPTMEGVEGVLDLGNFVSTFFIGFNKVEIPIQSYYIQ